MLLSGSFPDGSFGAVVVDGRGRPMGPVFDSPTAITSFQTYIDGDVSSLDWGETGYGWGLYKEWLGAGAPAQLRPVPVYSFEEHVKWEPENGMWLFERDVVWDLYPHYLRGDDRTDNRYFRLTLLGARVLLPGEANFSEPEFLYVLLQSEERAKAFIRDLNSFLATLVPSPPGEKTHSLNEPTPRILARSWVSVG